MIGKVARLKVSEQEIGRKRQKGLRRVAWAALVFVLIVVACAVYIKYQMRPRIVLLKLSETEIETRMRAQIRYYLLPEAEVSFLPGSGRAARWQSTRDPIVYYKAEVVKSEAILLQKSLSEAAEERGAARRENYKVTVEEMSGAPRFGPRPDWWEADGKGICITLRAENGNLRGYWIYNSGIILFMRLTV